MQEEMPTATCLAYKEPHAWESERGKKRGPYGTPEFIQAGTESRKKDKRTKKRPPHLDSCASPQNTHLTCMKPFGSKLFCLLNEVSGIWLRGGFADYYVLT